MLKTAREQLLAGLFGGSILLFGVWETAGQMLLRPLSETQMAVDSARSAVATLQKQSAVVEHSLRNLKQVADHSLPADPGKASVLYQGWLIRNLDQCSITSAIVTPAPAITEKSVGHRIPFSVQCNASTHNIAMFLDCFYGTPLLHRITNLNISNSTEGQAEHRVTFSIEAIAFDTANNIDNLPEPKLATEGSSLVTALSADDVFRRAVLISDTVAETLVETPQEATVTTPEPLPAASAPDPLQNIRFVASVQNGEQREAWLFDNRTRSELSLVASANLAFPDVSGRVLSIDGDTLHLELSGQRGSLRLGQTLKDWKASQ
jgi:hypothetical protein